MGLICMRKMISLLLLLAVVGCKKQESMSGGSGGIAAVGNYSDQVSRQAATDSGSTAPPPPAPATAPAKNAKVALGAGAASPIDRMIIRNAAIALVVRDTAKAIDAITTAIEGGGGYVASSNTWRESDVLHGKLSLRVPNARLSSALGAIRAAGIRVQSENISSEEVTQEYVDLASQVRNLEATEEELRQLLVTVRERAKKAADILEVHQQLTEIRGQIEQAKGRMRYLEQMTAYATINVELIPDAVAAPAVEPGWQPLASVKEATRALTNAGKALVTAVIWLGIYALPIGLFFLIAGFATWKLLVALSKSSRRRLQS